MVPIFFEHSIGGLFFLCEIRFIYRRCQLSMPTNGWGYFVVVAEASTQYYLLFVYTMQQWRKKQRISILLNYIYILFTQAALVDGEKEYRAAEPETNILKSVMKTSQKLMTCSATRESCRFFLVETHCRKNSLELAQIEQRNIYNKNIFD